MTTTGLRLTLARMLVAGQFQNLVGQHLLNMHQPQRDQPQDQLHRRVEIGPLSVGALDYLDLPHSPRRPTPSHTILHAAHERLLAPVVPYSSNLKKLPAWHH